MSRADYVEGFLFLLPVYAAALAAGAVILIRRALNPELKALKVDKLIVRKITTLENAARYQ